MANEPTSSTSFNGKFILRTLHLDALIEGGFDLVLGADQKYLYMCDWPDQKRHQQSLDRLAGHFGLTMEELVSLGTKGIIEKSVPKQPMMPKKYREMLGMEPSFDIPPYSKGENSILDRTVEQLKEYLDGKRRDFDLPVRPIGTDFQEKVWKWLSEIPFGELVTYRMVAYYVGKPKALQAVGSAVGSNPISIIIPCHRVLGADSLGGYAGGLELKKAFLAHEDKIVSLFGEEGEEYEEYEEYE